MSAADHSGYALPSWPFVPPPELAAGAKGDAVPRYPVVIVGAGLSGLTAACDLALRGVRALVLDEDDTVGVRGASSRGICYAQKSLEIFDRLGIYRRIRDKGVTWSVGRTMAGEDEVYSFDLMRDSASLQPPFINLQQFYIEWFLVDRINELGGTDLRWKSRVSAIEARDDAVRLTVETPAGGYRIDAAWLIDATGVNSPIRDSFGLETHMAKSADRWCIADVRFKKAMPVERWTWIEAPFNDNRAVWQHLMADGVWRLDYQMASHSDPEEVSRREVVEDRIRRHLGADVEFELVWVGPYSYRAILLERFRHGRVFFIGDAAHVVNPFGARGGNTGIQDAFNLAWKLALVLDGAAPEALLDSYDAERQPAAAENLEVTRRTARFLAPESRAEFTLRRAAISLAREFAFARPLVNTGRMSVANAYRNSPVLSATGVTVQNVAVVLPEGTTASLMHLLRDLGTVFVGIWFAPEGATPQLADAFRQPERAGRPFRLVVCGEAPGGVPSITDAAGKLAAMLKAGPGDLALIRPDLYLAGVAGDAAAAAAMLEKALALSQSN